MADPLLTKLQHRSGTDVLVLWAPDEVAGIVAGWESEGITVHRRMRGNASFVLACVRSCKDIADRAKRLVSLLGDDDPVLWIAYPKKSSKRYRSDVGRDDSWEPIGAFGFEPVRQVAIDDDWSALRFRRTERVKTMTRSRAISAAGKKRIAAAGRKAADDPAVARWIASLDEPRRSMISTLHDLVRRSAPDLAPALDASLGRVDYGPFHYRYESGREGDAHRVSVANNARYVSIYVLAGDGGGHLAPLYAEALGAAVDVGKSCIRVKKLDDIDLGVLAEVVEAAAEIHRREAST